MLRNTVRLQSGNLAVFSPVALTAEVKKRVSEMGRVRYITAPDAEHHIFLDDWHKEYPDAKLIGPDALGPKRQKSGTPLPFAHLWKKEDDTTVTTTQTSIGSARSSWSIDEEFDSEFDTEYVHSHPNKELVFNHRPTRTLIEADLLFNLPATEQMSKSGQSATSGWLTSFFSAMNSASAGRSSIWQKRFIWYLISAADRSGYNASVKRIAKWDFDRIIPCHGDVIETNGKTIYMHMFEWHLAGEKKTN